MEVYLPIVGMSVNILLILGMGGLVGFLSGLFGIGGGAIELIREVSRSLRCAVIVVPGQDEMYSKRCAMAY